MSGSTYGPSMLNGVGRAAGQWGEGAKAHPKSDWLAKAAYPRDSLANELEPMPFGESAAESQWMLANQWGRDEDRPDAPLFGGDPNDQQAIMNFTAGQALNSAKIYGGFNKKNRLFSLDEEDIKKTFDLSQVSVSLRYFLDSKQFLNLE